MLKYLKYKRQQICKKPPNTDMLYITTHKAMYVKSFCVCFLLVFGAQLFSVCTVCEGYITLSSLSVIQAHVYKLYNVIVCYVA